MHGTEDQNRNKAELKSYLKGVFKKDNLTDIKPEEVKEMLKERTVVDRLQYRKSVAVTSSEPEKVVIAKGEIGIKVGDSASDKYLSHKLNPYIGFKCLNYSVTESTKTVSLVVINKDKSQGVKFGVRTIDGTAHAGVDDQPGDYTAIDEIKEIPAYTDQLFIPIKIQDDEGIELDEDFFVELYDPSTGIRLAGEDTKTRITILDDDKPGIFGFETRYHKIRAKDERLRIRVLRLYG